MMVAMLFEVFINAFLLLILLYIVARDEADFEFRKVMMVTAGIVLGTVILDGVLTKLIGAFTIIPIIAFVVFMVMKFCWVRFWRSLLIVIPFLIINSSISNSVASFQENANIAITRGMQGQVTDEDMQIALSMFQDGDQNPFADIMESSKKKPEVRKSADQILVKKIMEWMTLKKKSINQGNIVKIKEQAGTDPKTSFIEHGNDQPDHEAVAGTAPSSDWQEAEKKIKLKGVMVGADGVRVALVNDQMLREGELIRIEHKRMIYHWRVGVIRENKVLWEPVEAVKK
ncbi:hypothetical protein ACFLQL_02610 [Verrucomicrobiota bacterium]